MYRKCTARILLKSINVTCMVTVMQIQFSINYELRILTVPKKISCDTIGNHVERFMDTKKWDMFLFE